MCIYEQSVEALFHVEARGQPWGINWSISVTPTLYLTKAGSLFLLLLLWSPGWLACELLVILRGVSHLSLLSHHTSGYHRCGPLHLAFYLGSFRVGTWAIIRLDWPELLPY